MHAHIQRNTVCMAAANDHVCIGENISHLQHRTHVHIVSKQSPQTDFGVTSPLSQVGHASIQENILTKYEAPMSAQPTHKNGPPSNALNLRPSSTQVLTSRTI